MDEYIKRKDLAESIKKNVKPPSYSTRSQRELVEWCKDECIRQAHCLPFVCDVVPKSEVDNWQERCGEWHEVAELKSQRIVELEAELSKAKVEVARKIFEEIEKLIFPYMTAVMPNNTWAINLGEFAELKKKYTEGNDG